MNVLNVKYGLPWWLSSKEAACNVRAAGEAVLIPASGSGMATRSSILLEDPPLPADVSRWG